MPNRPTNDLPTRRDARGDTTETRRDWEPIQQDTSGEQASTTARLRISGGWLYRSLAPGVGVGLVFVPAQFDDEPEEA